MILERAHWTWALLQQDLTGLQWEAGRRQPRTISQRFTRCAAATPPKVTTNNERDICVAIDASNLNDMHRTVPVFPE